MPERTIVFSDVHLGAIPAANERAFLAFLDTVPGPTDDVLINGDLFDFWFEYGHVVPRGYLSALARLRSLADRGVGLRFLGGNHDAWAGSFLSEEVGMEVLSEPAEVEVGGRRAWVAHGDGLGGSDWGYRALKWATRSALGRGIFRWVHPDIGVPAARRASGTHGKHEAGPGSEASRADRLADHATSVLEARPEIELVIFGHAHRPELREPSPGRFYLNAGDWIHHRSYAIVTPDRIELQRFRPPGD